MGKQEEKQLQIASCNDCGSPIYEGERIEGRCYCGKCDKSWWVIGGRGKVLVYEDDPKAAEKSVFIRGVRNTRALFYKKMGIV